MSCINNVSVASESDTGEILEEERSGYDGYPHLTTNDSVLHIVDHPAFQGFGQYMLPRDDNTPYYDTPLHHVRSLLPYHNHVAPDIFL